MGPLGIPELIAIFIVALVVFGPKKLPELGKSLGKGLREFNKAKNELKATWDEQLREAERQLQDTKETIHQPVRETIAAVNSANPLNNEVARETNHESRELPSQTELKTESSEEHHNEPPSPSQPSGS
jgi:TatA/E family protein of Tat protein translocase